VAGRRDVLDHEPSHRGPAGLVLVAAVGVALTVALVKLPREASPLPAIARYATTIALPQWHTSEPVNEVVYGSRGFDTFGETFLLLAAVVGTVSITRRRERRRGFIGEELAGGREQQDIGEPVEGAQAQAGHQAEARRAEREEQGQEAAGTTPDDTALGTPGPERAAAMTVVVRGAVRTVAPILAVAGLYLVAWGYSPGGGFPGGAVLVGVVLFVYVAYGYRRVEPVIRPDVVEPLELAGATAIIVIELLGLVLKGSFSANFLPLGPVGTIRSGGILQAFSSAELIEVGTGLTLAIFGLLGMGRDWSPDQAERDRDGRGHEAPFPTSKKPR
jgi:multicomponent Na+:H+ antiporter subunit B